MKLGHGSAYFSQFFYFRCCQLIAPLNKSSLAKFDYNSVEFCIHNHLFHNFLGILNRTPNHNVSHYLLVTTRHYRNNPPNRSVEWNQFESDYFRDVRLVVCLSTVVFQFLFSVHSKRISFELKLILRPYENSLECASNELQ